MLLVCCQHLLRLSQRIPQNPLPHQLPDLSASVLPGCALALDRRLTSPGATPTQEEKLLLPKVPILIVLSRDTSLPGTPQDHSLWPPRWLSSMPSLTAHSLNSQLPEAPPPNPGLLLCFQGNPNLMPGFIIRREELGHTHTQGRRPRESRGKDWRDAAKSQGTPSSAGNQQKLAEAGRTLPWSLQKEHGPADTLILELWPLGL